MNQPSRSRQAAPPRPAPPVVRPLAGGGLVAHSSGMLLASESADDVTDRLLEVLRTVAESGGTGRTLIRRAAQVLAEAMSTNMASYALAGPADGGAAVLVCGAATVTVTGAEGEVTLGGRTALTWTDRFVAGPVSRIELRLPDAGRADPRCRLDAGVVPGGGLEWLAHADLAHARASGPRPASAAGAHRVPVPVRPTEVPTDPRRGESPAADPAGRTPMTLEPVSEPPAPGDIAPDDIRSQPFESVLLIPPAGQGPAAPPPPPARTAPEPDARPEVWGGDCKNGHFNDPRSHYCGICGIGMAQLTIVPKRGPRPPLGVLVLDDGMALRLDTDYLLGRDPERDAQVTSGKARPARVDDHSGSVSRRHLQVRLHDWDVQLVDLGSVNGTYVLGPGESDYRQIPPRQPVTIWPGTTVRLGASRNFRYESHRKN